MPQVEVSEPLFWQRAALGLQDETRKLYSATGAATVALSNYETDNSGIPPLFEECVELCQRLLNKKKSRLRLFAKANCSSFSSDSVACVWFCF